MAKFIADYKQYLILNSLILTTNSRIKRFEVGTLDFNLNYDTLLGLAKQLNELMGREL